MSLAHILDRAFNTPLFITPAKAEVIAAVILGRLASGLELSQEAEAALAEAASAPDASRFTGTRNRQGRPYALTRAADGVALIDIHGSLVNRGAWVGSYSGLTSYEGIEAALKDAVTDPEVRAIALDINSPGGEATGMFGLAEKIRSARDQKPIVAVVNDMAASAAYGLASAAHEIAITPTSIVGSIGVVMMHLDRSVEMQKAGIRPTLIHAGAHKVDGHPFGPLSDDVRADLQRSVDTFYARFLETVEAGRGRRTTAEMARATEARTYIGAEAIEIGLADRVASLDQVIGELSNRAHPAAGRFKPKRAQMSNASGAPAAETAGFTQAQMDEATARARAEGHAEGVKAGATGERQRISAILKAEEARGREPQATTMALDTDLSAEDAKKILAASPKGSAVPPIADRSAGPEIGSAANPAPSSDGGRKGWTKAVETANRRFG